MEKRIIAYIVALIIAILYCIFYTFCNCMMQQSRIWTFFYDFCVGIPSSALLAIAIELINRAHEKKQNRKNIIAINAKIETKLFYLLNTYYRLVVNCYDELKCSEIDDNSLSNNTYNCLADLLSDINDKVKKIDMATIPSIADSGNAIYDIRYKEIGQNIKNIIDNEEPNLEVCYDEFVTALNDCKNIEPVLLINGISSEADIKAAGIINSCFDYQKKNNSKNYIDLCDDNYFKKINYAFNNLLFCINQDSTNKETFYLKYLNNQQYIFKKCFLSKY